MDDGRDVFEFAYALYLAREVDRDVADLIAQAAEAGVIRVEQTTEVPKYLTGTEPNL
jgi:hypothetical protein